MQIFGGEEDDSGYSVSYTPDGGYVVVGDTLSTTNGTQKDALIARFSNEGTLKWAKTFGGSGDDSGFAISISNDENIVVTGRSFENLETNRSRSLIVKIDGYGSLEWIKTGQEGSLAISIIKNPDESYTTIGTSASNALLMRFDADGNFSNCNQPSLVDAGSISVNDTSKSLSLDNNPSLQITDVPLESGTASPVFILLHPTITSQCFSS